MDNFTSKTLLVYIRQKLIKKKEENLKFLKSNFEFEISISRKKLFDEKGKGKFTSVNKNSWLRAGLPEES